MPEAIVFQWERAFGNHFAFKQQRFNLIPCQGGMTLTKTLMLILPVSIFFCTSCIESSYFHHPLQGNNNAYHTIPVASDSIKAATYTSGALSLGGMNNAWRDVVFTLQAGLHRSHVINHFRLNYGASLALGSYDISAASYYSYQNNGIPAYKTGGTFFGAYGLHAGINAARRLSRRGEWRYIGAEGSLFNEFGDYNSFRKNLPDSVATEIDKKKYLGSLGLNTEFVMKFRSKVKFGIKIAAGTYFRRLHYYSQYQGAYYHPYDDLIYFSNTYHFTFKKNTVYLQYNFATHAFHFQVGYNYRL